MEICNVTRDEAIRVLDACHMDETMAIERFLSGSEVSTWSEVSKKKKSAAHNRSGPGPKGNWNHTRPSDRDRDRDRRDRDRDRSFQSDSQSHMNGGRRGPRQHGQFGNHQRSKDAYPTKKRNQDADVVQETFEVSSVGTQIQGWGNLPGKTHVLDEQSTANGSTTADAWQAAQTNQWIDSSATVSTNEVSGTAWNKASSSSPVQKDPWSTAQSTEDQEPEPESKAAPNDVKSSSPVRVPEPAPKQILVSTSTVKPNLNYAAAAAAGTSHEKTATQPEKKTIPAGSVTKVAELEPPVKETVDEAPATESVEVKKRRDRGSRKPRSRHDRERPRLYTATPAPLPSGEAPTSEPVETTLDPNPATADSPILEAPAASTNAWSAPPPSSEPQTEKHLDESSTAVAVAAAAVIGSEQNSADSLSLQFGSFGLAGLDGVNWSTTDQKASEPVSSTAGTADTPAVAAVPEPSPSQTSAPIVSSAPVVPSVVSAPVPSVVPSTQLPASAPLDVPAAISSAPEVRAQVPPSISAPISSGAAATGSGMFPMLQVGHGGSFPPPNYPNPYMVPSLHGYSPAIPSYDNSGELGSSRAPNLGPPGSMPLYDPSAIPGMQTGTGKYGTIPGLGDISALQGGVQAGINKEGLHGANSDVDKSGTIGTSGLPSGMDPLAPPYLMAGYPSMQYPLYPFPTGPYGPPPGMAPGPSPFPYPTAGQVSSQGGRGGFGFEDASVGIGANSRNGSGLSESMYTPGGYLNTSMNHTNSQKTPNDGAYKPVRPNPGNSLGAMGMPGGIVHGMAYQDYAGGMPGVSSGVVTGGPGSWNNRQPNSGRADGGNGPGMNQSIPGASQNSSVYAAGPGAPNGYWGHQQGGYYS
ncbi:UBA-like protein [Gracilaria domingensis]|nr:UBA-like protein [Gracilaria domingensis]